MRSSVSKLFTVLSLCTLLIVGGASAAAAGGNGSNGSNGGSGEFCVLSSGTNGSNGSNGSNAAGGAVLSVSKSTVELNETFTATVMDAGANCRIDFALESVRVEAGSSTTDATGTASIDLAFESNQAEGIHQVVATGVDEAGAPFSLRQSITISGGSDGSDLTGGGGTLPNTGGDALLTLGVAGGLVGLALAARRIAQSRL